MSKKDDRIVELEEQLVDLESEYDSLSHDYIRKCNEVSLGKNLQVPPKKKEYAGDLCFDWWPLSDWKRLSINKWSQGRYFQLCVGPLRGEFFEL